MQEVYMGKLHCIVRDICLVGTVFSLKVRVTHTPLHLTIPVEMWMPKPKDQNLKRKIKIVTKHSFDKHN